MDVPVCLVDSTEKPGIQFARVVQHPCFPTLMQSQLDRMSSQMHLIFSLGRLDMLAPNDVGVCRGS